MFSSIWQINTFTELIGLIQEFIIFQVLPKEKVTINLYFLQRTQCNIYDQKLMKDFYLNKTQLHIFPLQFDMSICLTIINFTYQFSFWFILCAFLAVLKIVQFYKKRTQDKYFYIFNTLNNKIKSINQIIKFINKKHKSSNFSKTHIQMVKIAESQTQQVKLHTEMENRTPEISQRTVIIIPNSPISNDGKPDGSEGIIQQQFQQIIKQRDNHIQELMHTIDSMSKQHESIKSLRAQQLLKMQKVALLSEQNSRLIKSNQMLRQRLVLSQQVAERQYQQGLQLQKSVSLRNNRIVQLQQQLKAQQSSYLIKFCQINTQLSQSLKQNQQMKKQIHTLKLIIKELQEDLSEQQQQDVKFERKDSPSSSTNSSQRFNNSQYSTSNNHFSDCLNQNGEKWREGEELQEGGIVFM